jgi:hypothetical protein
MLLCSLLFSHFSLAEMLYLDKDMKLSNDSEAAWYKMETVKEESGGRWKFTLTRKNGARVSSGHLVDLHADFLFAAKNLRGEFIDYDSGRRVKVVKNFDDSGKVNGAVYEYAYSEYDGKYTERLARIYHYVSAYESVDDKIINSDGSSLVFVRDKNDEVIGTNHYDKNNKLKKNTYHKIIKGIDYEISEEYGEDSQLKNIIKNYHIKKEGALWGYTERFDAQNHLLTQKVADYQHEPASVITYGADQQVLERHIFSHYNRMKLHEFFDADGHLIKRDNIDEDGRQQGLHIFELDGETIAHNYKDGKLDGLSTITRKGRIVSMQYFKQGKLVSNGYRTIFFTGADSRSTEQIKNIYFFEYNEQSELISDYNVGAEYIRWNDNGEPILANEAIAHSAPALTPDVMSLYSYGGKDHFLPLMLESVDKDVAVYNLPDQKVNVQLSTQSVVNPDRLGEVRNLLFPLTLGKIWKDEWEMPVEMKGELPWRYHYQGKSTSKVIGLEKITVAAGEYDAFVIQRVTKWTKSHPVSQNPSLRGLTCQVKECTLAGYNQTFFWYAPQLGSIVLKAVEESENPLLLAESSAKILAARHAVIIELVYQGTKPADVDLPPTKYASLSDATDQGIVGHVFRPNNSWEYMMAGDISVTTRLPW